MMQTFDLLIIGAGPGGYQAASYAARNGLKVALFEAARVGGTCLNEGCIPTKCYARHAELMLSLRDAELFGMHSLDYHFDFAQVVNRKNEVVQQLRQGIETLLSHPNITLVQAETQFVDAHTVTIAHASATDTDTNVPDAVASDPDADTTFTAPYIILATGSVPKTLRIAMPEGCVLDSSDLLETTHQPESLCIVGAGVIGMEFASIFSAFGTKVTVVEFLKECLPALDSDIAKRLRKVLEKRGVEFHMQCAVTGISRQDNGRKLVVFNDKKGREQTVEADDVLMAVGRAPRVFSHFSRAGIDFDERNGVHVDAHFETNVRGIYAIGDCNGRQMLAHAAKAQARMVVDSMLEAMGQKPQSSASDAAQAPVAALVPAAIFTNPEAACVGMSEDQLKAEGTAYECRKAFYRANGKALAMNESEGMLKLLSKPDAGRIVGCHAFGAHSADLIQEASVLMARQTTVAQLRQMIHIHPTLSEILLEAGQL